MSVVYMKVLFTGKYLKRLITMRMIKFRGKIIDKAADIEKFAYGCLDFRGLHSCPSDTMIIEEMNRGVWYVDRSTIGQFIGAYDCNGTEIYEGDICEFEGKYKFIVKWDDNETGFLMFRLDGTKSPVQFHGGAYKKLKVVGNIFDNAEWQNISNVS